MRNAARSITQVMARNNDIMEITYGSVNQNWLVNNELIFKHFECVKAFYGTQVYGGNFKMIRQTRPSCLRFQSLKNCIVVQPSAWITGMGHLGSRNFGSVYSNILAFNVNPGIHCYGGNSTRCLPWLQLILASRTPGFSVSPEKCVFSTADRVLKCAERS